MGAATATTSKLKPKGMKKPSAAKKQFAVDDCLLKVGQRISDRWYNDDGTDTWYYDDTIVSIDYDHRTSHVHYI